MKIRVLLKRLLFSNGEVEEFFSSPLNFGEL